MLVGHKVSLTVLQQLDFASEQFNKSLANKIVFKIGKGFHILFRITIKIYFGVGLTCDLHALIYCAWVGILAFVSILLCGP